MPYVEWTDDMGEISGFGGEYEAMCRRMVKAGVEFWDAQDAAFERGERPTKFEPVFHGFKGVTGLCMEDNADAEALTAAIVGVDSGLTGAMHHAAVMHVIAFRLWGAERYCEELRNRERAEAIAESNARNDGPDDSPDDGAGLGDGDATGPDAPDTIP